MLTIDFRQAILLFLIAILISTVGTKLWIGILKQNRVGQPIRKVGNKDHYKKEGTPTMGGLAFTVFFLIISLIVVGFTDELILLFIGTIGYGFIGFLDDYEKVKTNDNDGLTPNQKLILQFVVAALMVIFAEWRFDHDYGQVIIPIVNAEFPLSFLAYGVYVFIIVGTTNAKNLTDGLDGLLSGVSIPVFIALAIIATMEKYFSPDVFYFGLIFAGLLLGYLFYNSNPASVMMGDTGSMAIGGAICAMLLTMNLLPYLIVLGGIYFIEAVSVLLQRYYYKYTGGKRIFLMSPIHHHYELKGFKEQKITVSFSLISGILALITLLLV